jgi:hypothetical protein
MAPWEPDFHSPLYDAAAAKKAETRAAKAAADNLTKSRRALSEMLTPAAAEMLANGS